MGSDESLLCQRSQRIISDRTRKDASGNVLTPFTPPSLPLSMYSLHFLYLLSHSHLHFLIHSLISIHSSHLCLTTISLLLDHLSQEETKRIDSETVFTKTNMMAVLPFTIAPELIGTYTSQFSTYIPVDQSNLNSPPFIITDTDTPCTKND